VTKILWPQLGWRPLGSSPGAVLQPPVTDGTVGFFVVAPWCPDCREAAARLPSTLPEGMPIWLVGEFAPVEETIAFAREFNLSWPILIGTSEKTEVARNAAKFRQIRSAWGDGRKWGLPLWIEGRIAHGWLEVSRVHWPE